MLLSDIITEVGSELDRSDIDTRIKRWIQQSIDQIHNNLEFELLNKTRTLTSVSGEEIIILPTDFGQVTSLMYTPGNGSGYTLKELPHQSFFSKFPDQNVSSFVKYYCIYSGMLFLSPLPADDYTFTLRYVVGSSNVYEHPIPITDNDAADSEVAIYLDEDGVSSKERIGKLYFVSPTEEDGKVQITTADGHKHEITVYHDDNAATLGVKWYFDEDGTNSYERNLFVSPTGRDCIVIVDGYRNHGHFIKFIDADAAASDGVQVNIDEDAAVKSERLLFVSPTNVNGTSDTVPSLNLLLSPFVERYYEGIIIGAVAKGLRWSKEYEAAGTVKREFNELLSSYNNAEKRNITVTEAKPFGVHDRDVWDSLKFPTIDD